MDTETEEYSENLILNRRVTPYQLEPTDPMSCPPGTNYHPGYFREHGGKPVYINAHCDVADARDYEQEGRQFYRSNLFQRRGSPRRNIPLEQNDCPPGTRYQPGRVDRFNGRPYYREPSCDY